MEGKKDLPHTILRWRLSPHARRTFFSFQRGPWERETLFLFVSRKFRPPGRPTHYHVGMHGDSVVALAEGALEAVSTMKLKMVWVLLLGVCLTGASAIAWQAPPTVQIQREPSAPDPTLRTDRYGDQLPSGAIRRLGTVRFRHGSHIAEVKFSADGKTLISRGWQQSVSFWDPATGKELRRVLVEPEQRPIALSPDGKLLACCKEKVGPICLRDMATGKVIRQFAGNPGSVLKAAFSPDGQILVATAKDAALCFWKVATGEELRRIAAQPGPFMALAFAPDGKTLASVRGDDTVCLWETATGRELRTLEKQGHFFHGLAFSPDGKLLAWGSSIVENGQITDKGRIILWDMTEHKEVRRLTGQLKQIGGLAFSPDGKYLVSGGGRDDGSIRLWEVATGKKVRQTAAHSHWTVAFTFSPDGKTLASGSTDGTVGVWEVATGKDLRPSTQGHLAAVNGLALSPDGRILASGSWDRTIRLWNPLTGEEIRKLVGHTDTVFRLAFSPDGKLLASAGFDGSIRLWNPATGKEIQCLLGHTGRLFAHVYAVGFSPDGRTLVSCGSDGTVRLWDPTTGKESVQLKGPPSGIQDVTFSPDGHSLAGAAYDGSTYVWEVASKKRLQLRGHENPWVHCVAFSPDGRTLASGSSDRTIRLWDAKTGEARGRLTGHEELISSLAFTADGRTLISTSYDRTIRLWELATGKERRQFRVDRGWPRTVVIAPDSRTLYTSGDDSTLLVWNIYNSASQKLTSGQERALWADLQSTDAGQAFRAESVLLAVPEQAVSLLRGRLRPAVRPDPKKLDRLLADLDSSEFAVRQKAEAELDSLGDLAKAALRKALEHPPSPEVRLRVKGLLKKFEGAVADPEKLRSLRAMEVLEQIATPAAREVLKILADGAEEALVTREAKASLQRLARRSPR